MSLGTAAEQITASTSLPTTPLLLDLLSSRFAPIQENIIRHLEVLDLHILQQTCRQIFDDRKAIINISHREAFNINRYLCLYFTNPNEFRSLQGKCSALIHAIPTLEFFLPSRPRHQALLVLVEEIYIPAFREYLQREGYVREESEGEVIQAFRKKNEKMPLRTIFIERTETPPLLHILQHSFTTATLNFISWNKAYCLFPLHTLIDKEAYLLQPLRDGDDSASEVGLLRWDFHIRTKGIAWHESDSKILERKRRVGDKYTYTIKLDTNGVTTPRVPDSVIESSTFCLREISTLLESQNIWQGGTRAAYYKMQAECRLTGAMCLRYRYITRTDDPHIGSDGTPQPKSKYVTKIELLGQRLEEQGRIQYLMIPPEVRENLGTMTNRDADFRWLAMLGWWDDEVVRLLGEAWMEEQEEEKM